MEGSSGVFIFRREGQRLIRWKYTGTPILVPLTPSLYVPGKLASTDTVLVDIGTGFYVEKVRFCRFQRCNVDKDTR